MNLPSTSVAVASTSSVPSFEQRVGDLDLVTRGPDFRVTREPEPWLACFTVGVGFGVVFGVMTGLFTGQDHGLTWGLVGFTIAFSASVLGALLVMRRRLVVEVRSGVLLWQDSMRFFGRTLQSIDLREIDEVVVNRQWLRIELHHRSGKTTLLLPGVKEPGLGVVGHLVARRVDDLR